MKINNNHNALIESLRQCREKAVTGGKPGRKAEEKAAPHEKVDLSATAKDIQRLKNAVAELPDVRQDKVDELKARIEKGEYSVSADKIAEKIIKEFLSGE